MTRVRQRLLRAAIMLLCVFVPPMVTNRSWWVVGRTYDGYSEPFEVLGMLVSAAVLLYWFGAFRDRDRDGEDGRLGRMLAAAVTGIVVMQTLYGFVNHAGISWDYRCYDNAARNVARGLNPYDGTAYLYPPLLAQALAWVDHVVESTRLFAYANVTSWWIVFYFYQALQLFLVFSIAELSFAFTRRLGIPALWAAAIVLVVFVADAPLFRTLRFQQTNLIVLVAILYSMVRLRERPVACGVLMAVAVMVKPQGIVFPLVWLFIGARRATLGFLAAAAVLVVVQASSATAFATDWTMWRQFADSVAKIPQKNDYFRNQSLFSVISTLAKTVHVSIDKNTLLAVVRGCYVAVLGWFVYRFLEREKRFRTGVAKVAAAARARYELVTRVCAHTADVVLLALLCAPIVWEHHYAIAMPLPIWIVGMTKGRVPAPVIVALVLMFVPSTFDVWLLSYHRLAGAVMLAVLLSPVRVFDLAAAGASRKFPSPAAEQG